MSSLNHFRPDPSCLHPFPFRSRYTIMIKDIRNLRRGRRARNGLGGMQARVWSACYESTMCTLHMSVYVVGKQPGYVFHQAALNEHSAIPSDQHTFAYHPQISTIPPTSLPLIFSHTKTLLWRSKPIPLPLCDSRCSQLRAPNRGPGEGEGWYGWSVTTTIRTGYNFADVTKHASPTSPSWAAIHIKQSSLARPTNLSPTHSPCLAGLLLPFCAYHTCLLLPQWGFRIASSHETEWWDNGGADGYRW